VSEQTSRTPRLVPQTAPLIIRDSAWLRAARWARWLAWASLFWMTIEGAVGLASGFTAGSIALVGWALSSVVEGLASVIVIWRFTGSRTLSETAERRAQKGVAISFWLLAPYVAIQSVRDLLTGERPETSLVGIGLTISSLVLMPALGVAKQRLGRRLGSGATAGEGTQNLLCAYLAGAVLLGLVANTLLGWWWLDPVAGLAVAAVALKEGREAWRGENCCAAPGLQAAAGSGCGPGCDCGPDCADGCCGGPGEP
jgi:divalent metal cation (Fe/Co/Zn/Cd) transporter